MTVFNMLNKTAKQQRFISLMQIHVDIFWFCKMLTQVFELKYVSVYTKMSDL